MTTKWNALALGLAATVIFSAVETQAQAPQSAFASPATISVTRAGPVFNFTSNLMQETGACGFTDPLTILGAGGGEFPNIDEFGVPESPPGPLTVNRADLLATLDSMEATFALFCTECGTNTGDFGAQALRAKIRLLEVDESATLHTLYFLFEPCSGDV
jgi:hypothetical protein